LTDLWEGQEATVLQLPAQPVTAAEIKAQEFTEATRRSRNATIPRASGDARGWSERSSNCPSSRAH
jgi:hypothetical protein